LQAICYLAQQRDKDENLLSFTCLPRAMTFETGLRQDSEQVSGTGIHAEDSEEDGLAGFLGDTGEPFVLAVKDPRRAPLGSRALEENVPWKFRKTSEICSHCSTQTRLIT